MRRSSEVALKSMNEDVNRWRDRGKHESMWEDKMGCGPKNKAQVMLVKAGKDSHEWSP